MTGERTSDAPFRIAVLGDFSGRANRGDLPSLRTVPIDPGNFEEVMEELGSALDLPGGAVRFRELDDFHPDQLYQLHPLFKPLREAKKLFENPQTFQAPQAPAAEKPQPPAMPPVAPSGSLLDQIAGMSPARTAPATAPLRASAGDETAWDQAIRNIGAKHAKPGPDPRQTEALALADQAAGVQLRAILSHPDFQAMEAAWRSLFFLFQNVETGVEVQIELIDISKDELLEKQAELVKLLAVQSAGETPWSIIAGLFTFSPTEHDSNLLARLGAIARQAGAPFIAAMDASLFGCESIAESPDPDEWSLQPAAEHAQAWLRLRHSADAPWIGLVFPRFLLRLPYGKKTNPIDSFDFEEMPHAPAHAAYLWGNPAIACVAMLGESFNQQGWDLELGSVNRLHSLPVHSFPTREPTPSAEIWMTDRLAEIILAAGLMPLASVRHSDAIQLVRFQSIAHSSQPIAGPW